MVATWRPEYGELMKPLGKLLDKDITVGVGGYGWSAYRADYPAHWEFPGALQGRSYVNWLRQWRICVAPLTRDVLSNGTRQPGDEDSKRTYELAAAHCFFIHRRTGFVQTHYEAGEVPRYATLDELCAKIERYRDDAREGDRMATNAHSRAVPAYALDSRAASIVEILGEFRQADANGE
jgi:Glycosyl transferases group 1